MGTSTFSGPVRSESGFDNISKNTTTGAITTDRTITVTQMTAGTGITTGTGTLYEGIVVATVSPVESHYYTRIFIDLTGLSDGGTTLDIIGVAAAANCHLGQITTAVNGLIFAGRMSCLEAPLTGGADIDLYSATEATGTNDALITGLTETALVNAGTHTLGGVVDLFTAVPAANEYLYLAGVGTGDAVYTAGRLVIELWGSDPT